MPDPKPTVPIDYKALFNSPVLAALILVIGVVWGVNNWPANGPNTPVGPAPVSSLRSFVPNEVADVMGVLYHDMALFIEVDTGRVDNPGEKSVIVTVKDVDQFQKLAIQGIQQKHPDWPSLVILGSPLKKRLVKVTGTDGLKTLDTNLRSSIVLAFHSIGNEFGGD